MATDPYYSNVVSLVHFDGTDGSTYVPDEKRTPWTCTGTVALSSAIKKFGSAALYLNNSGHLLSGTADSTLTMGDADFTVEFFYYPLSLGSTISLLFDGRPGGNGKYLTIYHDIGGRLYFFVNNSNVITSASGVLAVGNWYHIAVSRASGVSRLFVNGIKQGSDYTDATSYLDTIYWLGDSQASPGYPIKGCYDELRLTKGVGRYTADFTPPTEAFGTGFSATVAGTVKFGSTPEARVIKLLDLANDTTLATSASDATTGDYSITLGVQRPLYGIAYIDYGLPWVASKAYALNDRTWPYAAPNGRWYKCTAAGTSGTTEPTWPTTTGGTVTDGTVTWTDQGLMERPWIEGPYLPS